jgi:hypothetical protein
MSARLDKVLCMPFNCIINCYSQNICLSHASLISPTNSSTSPQKSPSHLSPRSLLINHPGNCLGSFPLLLSDNLDDNSNMSTASHLFKIDLFSFLFEHNGDFVLGSSCFHPKSCALRLAASANGGEGWGGGRDPK